MLFYLKNTLSAMGYRLPEQWDLIFNRRSSKAFSHVPLKDTDREAILSFLDRCALPFESQDLHIDWISEETLDNLFFNRKRQVVAAPQYLIFRCIPDDKALYNLGALLQQLALWLHASGYSARLQSRFYIGIEEDDDFNDYAEISSDIHYTSEGPQLTLLPLVMAIGTPAEAIDTPRPRRRPRRSQVSGHKNIEPIVYRIISAAIAAPTERGEVPWHFAADERTIDIYMSDRYRFYKKQRRLMRKVSVGCMLANSMFAAGILNHDMTITIKDAPPPKGNRNYVCTLVIRP